MADSKKYDGSQWEHSLRKQTTATEVVENPLYSDGTAITSYTISGNTVQNGTPTPDNPIMPEGTGERTENLFDVSSAVRYEYVITNTSPGTVKNGTLSAYAGAYCYVIKASPGVTYTLKVHTSDAVPVIRAGFYSLPVPSREDKIVHDGTEARNRIPNPTITITNSGNYPYLILQMSGAYVQYLTITVGSTPPASFIPYGYKIPISSGGVTTNIYLGSTQTTRQIMSFELESTKPYFKNAPNNNKDTLYYCYSYDVGIDKPPTNALVCSHLATKKSPPVGGSIGINGLLSNNPNALIIYINFGTEVMNAQPSGNTVAGLKEFIQSQTIAGTPVTVWYVLATPETAAVNEPLMKIGECADTVSNATVIPTAEGANTITVDTTVQPSEFTATWTGWHNAMVKEWDGSQWNE